MTPVVKRRVAITGMGVVTPMGLDLPGFWQKLTAGCSAVGRIQRFDVSAYPTQIAAEVLDFPAGKSAGAARDCAGLGRIAEFAMAAVQDAIEDSCLSKNNFDRTRAGVLVAAGLGSYHHNEVFAPCAAARPPNQECFDWSAFIRKLQVEMKEHSAERRSPGTVPALIAHRHRFLGPVMAVMTACAAGTQALGDAARWIRIGLADVVIAGGSDSELYPMGLASYCLLGALSTRNQHPSKASRPFDAGRDGFVIGEGAGILILEELSHARRRGARIYAEVAGFGSAGDAYRITDPHPEGKGAILAMQRALRDAGIETWQVDYINAHGTSTLANDRIETLAVRQVFGDHASKIPISSTKSMIGHLTVAAGAVEAVATALTLQTQTLHPTVNYETLDPDCNLDYVPNQARRGRVEYALSNSFGFGGQCASLILRAWHE